jgi:hypothetical protein
LAKRGKYVHVIDKLPRLLGEEPAYQQKVDAVKESMLADPDFINSATALAKEYCELREEKDDKEAELELIRLHLEAVSQLMIARFEQEDVTGVRTPLGSVSYHLEPYARVEDPQKFYAYVQQDEDLKRKLTLNWQTINAISKDSLLKGEPEPPGVTTYSKVKIRLGD